LVYIVLDLVVLVPYDDYRFNLKRGMDMATRIYVGFSSYNPWSTREVFKSSHTPTQETHGDRYQWAMGPFRTMRGAKYMVDTTRRGAYTQHVDDAEENAKILAAVA
jgi:hypothetical protein